jgi:hypothetical protein
MQIDVQSYLVNGGALFHPYLSLYFQIRSFIEDIFPKFEKKVSDIYSVKMGTN